MSLKSLIEIFFRLDNFWVQFLLLVYLSSNIANQRAGTILKISFSAWFPAVVNVNVTT